MVVQQADGYPGTEAWDDWFASELDALEMAKRLATGEGL